jgi:hypothetical protein
VSSCYVAEAGFSMKYDKLADYIALALYVYASALTHVPLLRNSCLPNTTPGYRSNLNISLRLNKYGASFILETFQKHAPKFFRTYIIQSAYLPLSLIIRALPKLTRPLATA